MDSAGTREYHVNPRTWACGCRFFLTSRFLLCKHIVGCFEDIKDPWTFLRTVQRGSTNPFWTDTQLILLPEFLDGSDAQAEETDVAYLGDDDDNFVGDLGDSTTEIPQSDAENQDLPRTVAEKQSVIKDNLSWFNQLMDKNAQNESLANKLFDNRLHREIANLRSDLERRSRQRRFPLTYDPQDKSSLAMFSIPP